MRSRYEGWILQTQPPRTSGKEPRHNHLESFNIKDFYYTSGFILLNDHLSYLVVVFRTQDWNLDKGRLPYILEVLQRVVETRSERVQRVNPLIRRRERRVPTMFPVYSINYTLESLFHIFNKYTIPSNKKSDKRGFLIETQNRLQRSRNFFDGNLPQVRLRTSCTKPRTTQKSSDKTVVVRRQNPFQVAELRYFRSNVLYSTCSWYEEQSVDTSEQVHKKHKVSC